MKRIFTFLSLLMVGGALSAQEVYYTEGLDDGLPADWSIANDVEDNGWTVGTAADVTSQFFVVPGTTDGNVACFNDDGNGDGHEGGGVITTGMIDLTAVTGPCILEFHSFFLNNDAYGNETAKISASLDGTDWTEIADLGASDGFGVYFQDFDEYAGENVWLQFAYDDGDGWSWGWAIDNITISSEITLIPTRSYTYSAGPATLFDQAAEGAEYKHQSWIINNGFDEITSFDLVYDNGTDQFTVSETAVSILYGDFLKYNTPDVIDVTGNATWTVTLTNVNGSMEEDDNMADNSASFNLNAVSGINPDKMVVVEEATGTWCTWCPRGTVYMDEMAARFPDNFAGIAVHNSDPMVLPAYDSAIGQLIGGYPSAIFQRDTELNPDAIVAPSIADMQIAPIASILVGASLSGNALTTSAEVEYLQDVANAGYSLLIVAVEDNLTGTAANWSQINAYGGGGQGPMGGFELLSNSVAGLDYDHVAIGLIGGFAGNDTYTSASAVAGDFDGHTFETWTIPAGSVMDNMHLVGIILDAGGEVVNATSVSIDEALDNGLTLIDSVEELTNVSSTQVFPNPIVDNAIIAMDIKNAERVTVNVINTLGQTVESTDHGVLRGAVQLELDMNGAARGIYTVQIQIGGETFTHKVTKTN